MKKNNFSKGFTLIELLIVITIIGILAVALLPSVLGAPARARDAARKADLNNIIAAMETYNSDNQKYPDASAAAGSCVHDITALSTYFQGGKIPVDPQGKGYKTCTAAPTTGSYFYCKLDGTPGSYMLMAQMEIIGDATTNTLGTAPAGCDTGTGDAPAPVAKSGTGPWFYMIVK
jgi:general secretion pathway protein G